MTREQMMRLGKDLKPLDRDSYEAVLRHWDSLAKPLDALGQYEKIIARIGGILREKNINIDKRALIVFLSDNGIVSENVSQSDISVTHKVAVSMASGKGCVSVMAKKAGVDVCYVDIGMRGDPVPGISYRRVREGTRDFLKENAMPEAEALSAVCAGFDAASELIKAGNRLILLGEMGVGNTTTSTAIGCALLGRSASEAVGRGSGMPDYMKAHKADVIGKALAARRYDVSDPLSVLCAFGGYDIAGMVGAILACATLHVPAVIDGLITLSALLVAERLFPGIKDACVCSHVPREPMGRMIMESLGLEAPINASLALGEGSGAVLLVPQLDACLALYSGANSFEGIGMDGYQRF
ncbi:MAG: nicotinate-nucleotide--dimethylbenzimidazole phosphoribosyltransferase [Spirochaetales bacterium]|nr:nicotinate-nucleotide--dimethylbenzimidazole phosphoribosyltransferase [Spirochaetales bacterium]